jgi:hypothetical protein
VGASRFIAIAIGIGLVAALAGCARPLPKNAWFAYDNYKTKPHFRIFAMSDGNPSDGWAYGTAWQYNNVEDAIKRAMRECRRGEGRYATRSECRLYAVGDTEVAQMTQEELDATIAAYKSWGEAEMAKRERERVAAEVSKSVAPRSDGLVPPSVETTLPIMDSVLAEPDGLVLQSTVAKWIDRPALLEDAPDAFAIRFVGESMAPRFRSGDLLLINPSRPAFNGQDVLVITYPEIAEADAEAASETAEAEDSDAMTDPLATAGSFGRPAVVRELVEQDGERLVLRRMDSKKNIEIPRDRVESLYLVVGVHFEQ